MLMRRPIPIIAGTIFVSLACVPSVFAQNTPGLQSVLERLDRLEQQNRELLAEIVELRKELKKPENATATSESIPEQEGAKEQGAKEQGATKSERLDVQESRTAELAQAKVEASQRMPVSLTGMLLFNAFHNGKYGGTLQDPVTAGLTPSPASTGATFRQTVLGLKFHGPDLPGGGKVSGSFYMDFWGGNSSPDNNLLRIRLATIDFAWKNTTLTVGQDKPIVAPREPTTLAQVGLAPLTGAGNLWDWQPQARIEQRFSLGESTGLRAQAGVYQTAESYPSNASPALAGTIEKGRPGYEGRLLFFHGSEDRRFEVAPGVHLSTSHVAGTSVPSRLGTLDWLLKPAPFIEFSGAFFRGENAAGLGGLRQGFMVSPSGAVNPVHATGGWGQIALFATPRLSFHLFGGNESDRASDLAGRGVRSNFIYAGNMIYKLAPNVLAALELSQNRTEYIGAGQRLNNHYDLAIAYLF